MLWGGAWAGTTVQVGGRPIVLVSCEVIAPMPPNQKGRGGMELARNAKDKFWHGVKAQANSLELNRN